MSALAQAGTFRLGGLIVGTSAFRLYEGELGLRLPLGGSPGRGGMDIAQCETLSLALRDQVDPSLAATFSALKFEPVHPTTQGQTWRWSQGGSGQRVEFFTPAFEEEAILDIPALGVSAQSLNYLNFLIAAPIHAAALYRSGVLVQIPRPERYAIHKLIVSDRRGDGAGSLQAEKDRAQACCLIRALVEDRPDDLAEAYAIARAAGPQWRTHIDSTLSRMQDVRDLIEDLDG